MSAASIEVLNMLMLSDCVVGVPILNGFTGVAVVTPDRMAMDVFYMIVERKWRYANDMVIVRIVAIAKVDK